jgi:5' nucleotidase, deoxy (Pyrimidine), cytosolic type C protein (NT5C)
VALRIGFDLDGVLADMDAALLHQAHGVFGEEAVRAMQQHGADEPAAPSNDPNSPDDPADTGAPVVRLDMAPRQQQRLWQHVATIEDFWQSLDEIEPGVIARLAQMASQRRWEIIFLTKRPRTKGATAQVQSQRWLESKGFPLPSVFVVQGSRGRIASALALDVVVDDRPENCYDVVVDSQAKAILVWRDSPKALPAAAQRLGIGVVGSVAECLDVLEGVDTPTSDDSSLLSRFKRLLGVKQRADA